MNLFSMIVIKEPYHNQPATAILTLRKQLWFWGICSTKSEWFSILIVIACFEIFGTVFSALIMMGVLCPILKLLKISSLCKKWITQLPVQVPCRWTAQANLPCLFMEGNQSSKEEQQIPHQPIQKGNVTPFLLFLNTGSSQGILTLYKYFRP